MHLNLDGKYALVTGGSHGIGKAIAIGLAKEGCNVAICARGADRVSDVVAEIEKQGVKALGIHCDVLLKTDPFNVVDKIEEKWGGVDILINNVGGGGRWGTEVFEDFYEWGEVYEKNAGVARKLTMAFTPYMRKKKWGRVVTIASIHGKEGGGRPWFNMAKSAEISLMKTLSKAKYLVRGGITFNTVAPGAIMIPDTGWEKEKEENPDKFLKEVEDILPLGRLGTPEEVANVVTFLCSQKSSFVNGSCIMVDGSESWSF